MSISSILSVFICTIWLSQCINPATKTQSNPTQYYTLFFKSYDFALNNPKHWNWSTSADSTSTRACTKQFPNLCIHINTSQPGFVIEHNNVQYNFLNDTEFSHINIDYPLHSISPTHRQLIDDSNPGGLPFGTGGMGGMGDMETLGMMPGFGGSVGGMMPGIGQLGGMLNPNMGVMPSMGGGSGFGLGGSAGNPYPGYQMGYGNPLRHYRNMYRMFSRVLEGKPVWKRNRNRRRARSRPPRARRRGRRRGRYGRRGRRGGRRRKKNYMHDGGQFGKMGFPSLSGNMMGLVQSSKGMPKFMQVPPTIHITADFRRLLGVKTDKSERQSVLLSKCVVGESEICGVYNMEEESIVLRYITGERYEVNEVLELEEVEMEVSNADMTVKNEDINLMQLYMLNEWYVVWRNWEMFDGNNTAIEESSEEDEGYYEEEMYSFKTVVWSDMNTECNALLLSFIDYAICVKDGMIYFKDIQEGKRQDGDVTKAVKSVYGESRLLVANEMDWSEIYTHENNKNMKRLCRFMPIVKLCVEVDTNDIKIEEISVRFVSV